MNENTQNQPWQLRCILAFGWLWEYLLNKKCSQKRKATRIPMSAWSLVFLLKTHSIVLNEMKMTYCVLVRKNCTYIEIRKKCIIFAILCIYVMLSRDIHIHTFTVIRTIEYIFGYCYYHYYFNLYNTRKQK